MIILYPLSTIGLILFNMTDNSLSLHSPEENVKIFFTEVLYPKKENQTLKYVP